MTQLDYANHCKTQESPAMADMQCPLYSEDSVWLFENRKNHYKTTIQGTLAQILKQYPEHYSLRLLKIKG